MATQDQLKQWHELAQQLRVDSIRSTTEAGRVYRICATEWSWIASL